MKPERQSRLLNAINDIRDYRTKKIKQKCTESVMEQTDSYLEERIELRESTITRIILYSEDPHEQNQII